jgi:putative aldouronate transport system substrate-binding protein
MGGSLLDNEVDQPAGSANATYGAAWAKNNDGSFVMPSSVAMTAEEGAEFSQIMGDITTYVGEMTAKFIVGTEPLSNYDAFVSTIKGMNIDRAIALEQTALDRYNAR